MREIFNGKKKVFKKSEIEEVRVRGYNELKVSNILKAVLPNDKITEYLPDKRGAHYKIDSKFVLSIVKKLEPEFFEHILIGCRGIRQENVEDPDRIEEIDMP